MYRTIVRRLEFPQQSSEESTEHLTTALEILLGGMGAVLLVPIVVLFIEVMLSLKHVARKPNESGKRGQVGVLIPAHNESLMLDDAISSIKPQLTDSDRLLVIADNCDDDTASVAKAAGAEVIARTDPANRGKGYALDFGIRFFEENPPDTVVIIDADCLLAPGSIDRLAKMSDAYARPIQALYLMRSRKNDGLMMQVAEFAWVVKNLVRPMGLHFLRLPCHLTGSGMAFPWSQIRSARLGTGHIVEDMKLGIDLACAGTPAIYCPDAVVTSEFPRSTEGAKGQRTRWEHGHLGIILTEAPQLFWKCLVRRDLNLLALALDLTVPPLALLTLLMVTTWIGSFVLYLVTKARFSVEIASLGIALLITSVLLAWATHGRHIISIGRLALAGIYALMKFPMYAKFLVTRETVWIRSKRKNER